ncbi:MAG: hypothetical protein LBS31_10740 [Candidatus Adiutrix sp.]|jgi:uroporphyrinogen decarboxylase|nr:hypothetical protein [Candidatus Adiutrix sp.]
MLKKLKDKDRLSRQERMKGLIQRTPIDRVPFALSAAGLSSRYYGVSRGDYYCYPEVAYQASVYFGELFPWMDVSRAYGWADRGAWEFGGEIKWPYSDLEPAPRSVNPVVNTPEEAMNWPDPDPMTAGMFPRLYRFQRMCRREGLPVPLAEASPTHMSAGAVGSARFMRWMLREPEAVHAMQRKGTELIKKVAAITMDEYGPENCSLFSPHPAESNQLISPALFEKFCLPYIRELFDFYLAAGVRRILVHLCGDHTANLKYWLDMDLPDRVMFSIGHEMDLEKTGRTLGERYILAGNISNATLQSGSPEEVYETVKNCLLAGKRHPGGYVLMPACEIAPGTPHENLEAIEAAIFDHGFYQ